MRGEVAGLSNIGIGRVDGFPRLLKHHRSNAIRSCCRKRVEFGSSEMMRSMSLFKVVLVRSSPLLIRSSVPLCPVGLSWGGALSDVKLLTTIICRVSSGDSVSLPSGLRTVPNLGVL